MKDSVDPEIQASVTLLLLVLGVALYLLVSVWVPTQVAVGPLRLGDARGDCHGMHHGDTLLAEVCR